MTPLARAVNDAFQAAYPQGDLVKDTEDEAILCKRVKMLLEDLQATRTNFRVTNKAYADLDRTHRGISSSQA